VELAMTPMKFGEESFASNFEAFQRVNAVMLMWTSLSRSRSEDSNGIMPLAALTADGILRSASRRGRT
jgi:hypothetical protein